MATIGKLSDPCGDIGASGEHLWVSMCGDYRSADLVDTATGSRTQAYAGGSVGTPIPVAGAAWLPVSRPPKSGTAQHALLVKVDPTGAILDTIDLGDACEPIDALVPAVEAFGSVWLGCPNGQVLRLAAADLQ